MTSTEIGTLSTTGCVCGLMVGGSPMRCDLHGDTPVPATGAMEGMTAYGPHPLTRQVPAQRPRRSKQNYRTPQAFLDAVTSRLGIPAFALDLAADAENTVAGVYYDEATDALAQPVGAWAAACGGGWAWCNPPFTDIRPWAARCASESALGARIALLVPAAVGSNWYRDAVHDKATVLFLNGRIPFMEDRPTWGYPKDCLLALYGDTPSGQYGIHVWNWRTAPR